MLSKKTAMIISISLVFLFLLTLGISLAVDAGRTGMRVVTERKADPEALVQGGLENEKPYPVMPGDVININTADTAQLQRLPGIGPALAGAVITWREENGPFGAPSDLKKVPGIGEEIFAAVSDYVVTGDE